VVVVVWCQWVSKASMCLIRARALAKSRRMLRCSKQQPDEANNTPNPQHIHTRYRHKLQLSPLIMFASSSFSSSAFIRRAAGSVARPTGALLARPVQTQRRNISVGAKIPAVQLKEVRALRALERLNFAHAWVAARRARPCEARLGLGLGQGGSVGGTGAESGKYKQGDQAQSQAQSKSHLSEALPPFRNA